MSPTRCLPLFALALLPLSAETAPPPPPPLPALAVHGDDFVDAKGNVVRFWGVNLVSCFPDHARADALAADLASLQVNLVRPHHLLRESKDWSPDLTGGGLLSYRNNSRELDPGALDKFDYLNAALRRNGVYLAFSAHFTRHFLPTDAEIAPGDPQDREAWMAAMRELNSWPFQKSFDLVKILPCLDERAALLQEEFVKNLLSHVNPYTGTSYAADPQVLTFELINESSFEYAVVCGNRFPAYWDAKLAAKWKAFAAAAGIEPGDLYKPADAKARTVRAQFLRKLDEDYYTKIKADIRAAGCAAPVTFSNLWRGENVAEMEAKGSDHVENHMYMDPMVAAAPEDGFYDLTKNALAGKPFFVGELNQGEGAANIARQSPWRTMLPLASAAYGSLQDWSGLVWFAWTHGAGPVGSDGWSLNEGRVSDLGRMINDGMMIDHLRTAGILFRRGMVEKSKEPVTVWVDAPFTAGDYKTLMQGKYPYKAGWQDVHGIRKAFGPVPDGQAAAPWMTQTPPNPVVSDTGQIVKDTERRQLTVTTPQGEGFSGFLDGKPPAGPKCLALEGDGFATVIAVSDDGSPLAESGRLVVSKTGVDADGAETLGPVVRLRGLKKPPGDQHWYVRLTRPRSAAGLLKDFAGMEFHRLDPAADGALSLPKADWHECELTLR